MGYILPLGSLGSFPEKPSGCLVVCHHNHNCRCIINHFFNKCIHGYALLGVRGQRDDKDTVLFQKSTQSRVGDQGLPDSVVSVVVGAQTRDTILVLGTLQKLPGGCAL